jgi:hypothetical protein
MIFLSHLNLKFFIVIRIGKLYKDDSPELHVLALNRIPNEKDIPRP